MTQNIAEIARGLSELGREALLRYPNGYFDANTWKALKRRGLFANSNLTPLGQQVRAHLQTGADQ